MSTPRAPRWSVPLPDLAGMRAVVTGASDGVGVEIARAFAGAGADVVLPVRNRGKGDRAIAAIRATAPEATLTLIDLDLADLSSVAAGADALLAEGRPVELLVLNAGMIALRDPVRHTSVDGFELHFQTNHLGHVALVDRILPLLRAGGARVTVQSSLAARFHRVRFDDLQLEHGYSAFRAYGSSKVALSLFALELGRRSTERGWGLTTNVSHPGIAITNIGPAEMRDAPGAVARTARRIMDAGVGGTPAEASLPAVFAAASPDAVAGGFYGPGGFLGLQGPPRRRRPYPSIVDANAARRVWTVSAKLAGLTWGGRRAGASG
ncbi:SDR family oxidoreductase [Microbacterium sp. BK668]|uniref:SDR family oxidoreductase n=1 Tax=Microbacterium sp. BK668 TaxID=2512118 RepID=UPI00105E948A|nr:SDR family oxidoreductase [Microbacterium sp. BK668]TDN90808.1 NAD(P)-dependent dehydrogenase (short-subunit alcohol dehydrogenase family) [Microbacterium sp. BK668]